jgi:CheY-like chemotaxis protein
MKKMECILLVDDCEVDNLINYHIISKAEITEKIQVAKGSMNAFNFLRKNYSVNGSLPELILLDVNMPIMGGFEFRAALEKLFFTDSFNTLIVFLTNIDPSEIKPNDIGEFGETKVIRKPLTEEKLQRILEVDFLSI